MSGVLHGVAASIHVTDGVFPFDSAAASDYAVKNGASAETTWTHTVGSSSSAVLVYLYYLDESFSSAGNVAATCNGTPMTKLADVGSYSRTALFKLSGVTSGNKTMVATLTSGHTYIYVQAVSVSYVGATTFGTPVTAGAATSVSITGSESSRVSAGITTLNPPLTISPSQRITSSDEFGFGLAAGDQLGTGDEVSFTSDSYGNWIAVEMT